MPQLGWVWHERVNLQAFPDIIAAYTAKEYCSCRYVADNPAEYCRGYVKQYVPISAFTDDPKRSEVTASGLGRTPYRQMVGQTPGVPPHPLKRHTPMWGRLCQLHCARQAAQLRFVQVFRPTSP